MSTNIQELSEQIREKYLNVIKCKSCTNIIIKNNKMKIIDDNKVVYENILDISELKESFDTAIYDKLTNVSKDTLVYSPLEADRESLKYNEGKQRYWKNSYSNIVFPRFNVIMFLFIAITGRVPSVKEFCDLYINLYTYETDEAESPYQKELYVIDDGEIHGRTTVGNKLYLNSGEHFDNKLLKFRNEFLVNIPTNSVTTEQIVFRAIKSYGSLLRDFYYPVLFNSIGAMTYYSLKKDTDGIDMLLNDIPCFSYVSTRTSKEFGSIKQKSRHNCKDFSKALHFIAVLNPNSKDKLFYMKKDTAIDILNNCKNINGIQEYYY